MSYFLFGWWTQGEEGSPGYQIDEAEVEEKLKSNIVGEHQLVQILRCKGIFPHLLH